MDQDRFDNLARALESSGNRRRIIVRAVLGLGTVVVGVTDADAKPKKKCKPPKKRCGNKCFDLKRDADHCGSCKRRCPDGAGCVNGACRCDAGLSLCSGKCVDLDIDALNCGDCDTVCTAGVICQNGVCGADCPPVAFICEGVCVDIKSDRANCGACGKRCRRIFVCVDGACQFGQT